MNSIELNLQSRNDVYLPVKRPPVLARSIAIMKPITWFAPMWAFLCGAIASGATFWQGADIGRLVLGILMAGPVLCGATQALNDYFDREIDAINEPHRIIPAGLISIEQVFATIAVLIFAAVGIAAYLGADVLLFATLGLIFGVMYSAPPIRAKRNGWYGNTVVAISYEGLAWIAGHAAFGSVTTASVAVALLYSFGTHGIMAINDYKSIDGDKVNNIRTIPVILGQKGAAKWIVLMMTVAQLGVVAAFVMWGNWLMVVVLLGVMLVQVPLQRQFIQDPTESYLKFSAIGVTFFVWGMLFSAVGLRHI